MPLLLRRGIAAIVLLLAGVCHADDFTDRVVRAFRQVDSTLEITVKDANELVLARKGAPAWTMYIDNVRKECATSPEECDQAIMRFASRSVHSAPGGSLYDVEFDIAKVYPVLRSKGYAAQLQRMVKDPAKGIVVRQFPGHVDLLFMLDGAESIRTVTLDEINKAGLEGDTLMAVASRNVAKLPSIKPIAVPNRAGLFALTYADNLGCARLFDAALWDELEKAAGGRLAVAVPTRDWILYTRLDDAARVGDLRAAALKIATTGAYGVSGDVFRREGADWVVVDPQ